MAPAYDVAICYGCSGENGARYVSKRLMSAEVSDRLFAQGVSTRPDAPVDFGITQSEYVRWAYEGSHGYKKDGPFTNLRLIARVESPAYLMIAVDKASGITDLRQIRERKMPVRIMMGPNAAMLLAVLEYYGITEKDVSDWGGMFLAGNALVKNPRFDVMLGTGVLSNYPEGNMWYEMSQKKDLVFLQIPEDLRQKLAKEHHGELVTLPFRYLRGLDDEPHPTVGVSGLFVYGRDDLPDQFVRDVASGLDEKRSLIKWANQPFSYDPNTVCRFILLRRATMANAAICEKWPEPAGSVSRTWDGYQKRMISIALTTVPHTAAAAAASRMSAARKPQQMSRPSSSI
jgi:hypothetical protein